MLPVDATLADLLKEPERKPRLLVVDDQPTNIQVLYRVFADDCQVFMATSGEQALHTAREEAPDVILLDVMMPSLDGPGVLKRLRQIPELEQTPVIFMTARVQSSERDRYLELGAVGVITKPFDPMTLADQIRGLLRGA